MCLPTLDILATLYTALHGYITDYMSISLSSMTQGMAQGMVLLVGANITGPILVVMYLHTELSSYFNVGHLALLYTCGGKLALFFRMVDYCMGANHTQSCQTAQWSLPYLVMRYRVLWLHL